MLHFNHPTTELIWRLRDNLTNEEKILINKRDEERHKKYINTINLMNNAKQLKKNMDKLIKKISKVRKIYRKNNTLLNLEKLNNYEMEYRQFYNSYWYDCIFKYSRV
jgi:hypothetical protein